ncbi:MAG: RNA polymerase sigma factor [Woeseiaceae bacterium]|nr:RNA polymerase sigma factor [Woeseiaceae bacterium]
MTHDSRKTRFEAILRPHFETLYAAARRMTLSPVDAEDLVQDVALKAFEKMDELENIEYPRAWLLKVMYNRSIDEHRSAKRSPVQQASTGVDSDEPDDYRGSDWLPDELFDREVRITRILMAMKRLDSESAALVALRDIEGLTIAELQEMTGSPPGTIKAKLHRSRAKLGRLLSSDDSLKPELKAIGGAE